MTCLGLRTDTQLDHGCKDALGVRAGASITVRGRLRARKEGHMSADADDLFERAARALDRDIPTVDEVTTQLAAALDELERKFPDGQPDPDGDSLARLKYMNLVRRVTHCKWQLENGQCVEFPRGRRSRVESDPSWDEFLDAHPELAGESEASPREPLSFTDVELLRALRNACRNWDQRMPRDRRGKGVSSANVARELAGVSPSSQVRVLFRGIALRLTGRSRKLELP